VRANAVAKWQRARQTEWGRGNMEAERSGRAAACTLKAVAGGSVHANCSGQVAACTLKAVGGGSVHAKCSGQVAACTLNVVAKWQRAR
jgi:hypothetical protein